jgi:hypothetical protein
MNDRNIVITFTAGAAIMISLLIWYFTLPKDCWQRYDTEQEAIYHCEQPQQSLRTATQIKELQ